MRNDLEMIQDPDRWPHFPILPVVRENEAGFIMCLTLSGRLEGEIVLWRGNIFNAHEVLRDPANRVVYENAQAVIDDGWRVD
jgi:hypothetical protein